MTSEQDQESYEDWNVEQLKEEARNRDLTVSGTKDELIQRLVEDDEAEGQDATERGDNEEEDSEEEGPSTQDQAAEKMREADAALKQAADITAGKTPHPPEVPTYAVDDEFKQANIEGQQAADEEAAAAEEEALVEAEEEAEEG